MSHTHPRRRFRRLKPPRVLGPYYEPSSDYWRIVVIVDGRRTPYGFKSPKDAYRRYEQLKQEVALLPSCQDVSIDQAIDLYERFQRDERGNARLTAYVCVRRLRDFFPDYAAPLRLLNEADCKALYRGYAERYATATHHNGLAQVKSFLRWCVAEHLIERSPAENVRPHGRPNRGKPQLRLDEARRWLRCARAFADAGWQGAVAAIMTLVMGLRSSEVTQRVVRDVDDNATVLWIPRSKTRAGRRVLEIPAVLQPYLLRLVAGRGPDERLFQSRCHGSWRDFPCRWVRRICLAAGVPVVTAQGMRGAHATFATARGVTGHIVAAALGHESPTTTYAAYALPEAVRNGTQVRALAALAEVATERNEGEAREQMELRW